MVRDALSDDERERAIAYLDQRLIEPGQPVRLDPDELTFPYRSVVAFVDREPAANWSHNCRYLVVNAETSDVESFDAQFPPFLRGAPDTLRVVWMGASAPAWAVAVQQSL
ncbi:MAG TPA: hypothetical protein VF972_03410 [Actinomycetota bacterium]